MDHSRDFLSADFSDASAEYGPSPNSRQPQRFAITTNNNRIVPRSAVIDLDNQRQLAAMTIIIEKSQTKASIVSVRNWQQQKSRSIFYVNFDQNLIPKAEFLFDMRKAREADKSPVDGSYLTFPLHPIYIQEYPNKITVTNLIGSAYVFIHDLESRMIRVYHYDPRGLSGDQIDAQVLFVDDVSKRTIVMPIFNPETLDASQFVLLNSRDEFGNGEQQTDQSYATVSADVRKLIIETADPNAARRLCQTDIYHRTFCQQRLTAKSKSRICLDSTGAAQECDLIPMFSQRQFLELIPKNIEIFAEDPVHNTYEFYPQGYKLPTEGFAVALRKAKLMNTICAIIRPEFLFAQSTLQLEIPAYIDAKLLDDVRKAYTTASTWRHQEERQLSLGIVLYKKDATDYISIHIQYFAGEQLDIVDALFVLENSSSGAKNSIADAAASDNFLRSIMDLVANDMDNDSSSIPDYWSLILPTETQINAFRLSRLIKIAFDTGYHHLCQLVIWAGPQSTINTSI